MKRRASAVKVNRVFSFSLFLALLVAACGGQQATPTQVPTPVLNIPIGDLAVYVPAGSFFMGSQPNVDPLARPDEIPAHLVLLDGFFIYRNEVSNDLYSQCVAAGKCSPPEKIPDGPSVHYGEEAFKANPVVGVNWNQAQDFCTWADSRLPTEAEWEKTSRSFNANLYPWGQDDPSCGLSNLEGCTPDPGNTDPIGQHPDGNSFYQASDLSGNVWEWTADWYNPEAYALSARANPLGPDDGLLKVVRGGAYDSGPVDLRSAARMGLDPKMAYNNVGFRCVPIGLSSPAAAPFCQPAYVPFCNDPKNPNQDCTPPTTGQGNPTGGGNPDFLGFTCPQGGLISFTLNGNGQNAGDFKVTINGNEYNCVDDSGHILCTGPALSQNSIATISVCPGGTAGNGGSQLVALDPTPSAQQGQAKLIGYSPPQQQNAQLVAYQPQQAAQPQLQAFTAPVQQAGLHGAQYQQPRLQSLQAATNGYCPDGMTYNPDSGKCETNPNGACPDGWTYNPQTYQCEPGETGCPEGTTYNPDKQACEPNTGGECPQGYSYDEATNTCQPPGNNDGGGSCPQGYFYDQTIQCCSPIKGDNNGCDPGSYFSVAANQCQPLDQNGCGEGMVYNPYEGGCVPDNGGTDGSNGGTDGNTNGGCQQGYILNSDGVCSPQNPPTNGADCGPNAYYDYSLEQCIGLDQNGCGAGTYYNEQTKQCTPTTGPGSGCAEGYAYDEQTNCCAPTPGNDGSSCPGDQQAGASLAAFSNYDPGNGTCDPGSNGECPGGYYFNSDSKSCEPVPTSPVEPNSDNQCPQGYVFNPATNTCDGTNLDSAVVQCGDGQYFDYNLGYCVATSCGCALGYYFNSDLKTCLPNGVTTGEQGCVTFTESVPVCGYTPEPTPVCPKGETYQPSTRQCVRGNADCSAINNQSSCNATEGCDWTCDDTSYMCTFQPNSAHYSCQ